MNITGRIEIKDAAVFTKSGTGKNGREYNIREQHGFIKVGDEVRRISLSLDRDQAAYPAGTYTVNSACAVGRYGDLLVPRSLALTPVARSAKSA